MKSWLERNGIEMYSTHNEETSVVVERFIRTLKNTIYKYMSAISKNVYNDKLDDKVNKYNNRYHSTIKMKLVDDKLGTYIDSNKKINNKDFQKKNQKEFRVGKVIKKKGDKLYVKIVLLTVGLVKRTEINE